MTPTCFSTSHWWPTKSQPRRNIWVSGTQKVKGALTRRSGSSPLDSPGSLFPGFLFMKQDHHNHLGELWQVPSQRMHAGCFPDLLIKESQWWLTAIIPFSLLLILLVTLFSCSQRPSFQDNLTPRPSAVCLRATEVSSSQESPILDFAFQFNSQQTPVF